MTRYVLTELTQVFVLCLAALTGLFILVGVVREAINQGLPPAQVVQILPYILPDMLRYTIPVTLLLATTLVYSRMSGANEVVAIKALGISPIAMLWPTLVVAFLVSLVTVWLNDVAVSWGRSGVERVALAAAEEIAYGLLRTEHSYSTPQFSINVKHVEGRQLIHPIVTIAGQGSAPSIAITADEAELHANFKEGVLKITLRNATVDVEGWGVVRDPNYEHAIPLRDASRAGENTSSPSSVPLHRIREEITRQEEAIRQQELELGVRAGSQMLWGDFADLNGGFWIESANQLAMMRTNLCRLRTEPHRRWSAGFSCLCFVWIGAPIAIWRRRGEPLTAFFLCFAPILVVYYPLLAYGISGAKNGTIPPYSVWAGNLVLVLGGAWLLRKVMRY
ncbi:MAG: LptF/LptG family permease [Thermoguttaceae bacterium]